VVTLSVFFLCTFFPEDGHRSGPKHVVVVHSRIEHEEHLLRTVVLIKVLVDTRATGCITQQLSSVCYFYVAILTCILVARQQYISFSLLVSFKTPGTGSTQPHEYN
jgi:hypothetical protein